MDTPAPPQFEIRVVQFLMCRRAWGVLLVGFSGAVIGFTASLHVNSWRADRLKDPTLRRAELWP